MPRRNSLISRLRYGRAWDEWDKKGDDEAEPPVSAAEVPKRRSGTRQVAAALTFAALFVAGAAFSASAQGGEGGDGRRWFVAHGGAATKQRECRETQPTLACRQE